MILIDAIDEIPKETLSQSQIDAIKQRKVSGTGNLVSKLKLKIGAQVMLTSNLDIDDRLVNGLVGTVKLCYVKFNDNNATGEAMQ